MTPVLLKFEVSYKQNVPRKAKFITLSFTADIHPGRGRPNVICPPFSLC